MVLHGNCLGGWIGLIGDSQCIWDIISPWVCHSSPLDQIFWNKDITAKHHVPSMCAWGGWEAFVCGVQWFEFSSGLCCTIHIRMPHVQPCIPFFLNACECTFITVDAKTPSTAQRGSDILHRHSWNGLTPLPHEVCIFSISWALPFSRCVSGPRCMRGWHRWQLQQKLGSAWKATGNLCSPLSEMGARSKPTILDWDWKLTWTGCRWRRRGFLLGSGRAAVWLGRWGLGGRGVRGAAAKHLTHGSQTRSMNRAQAEQHCRWRWSTAPLRRGIFSGSLAQDGRACVLLQRIGNCDWGCSSARNPFHKMLQTCCRFSQLLDTVGEEADLALARCWLVANLCTIPTEQ